MSAYRSFVQLGLGLWTTLRQIGRGASTISYPEEALKLPPRWRGRPVLTRDPDGDERCVACQLCSAVCPTRCIELQAGEREDERRYPVSFRINFSRCIYCGFCEEACPTLAIQLLDEFAFSTEHHQDFIYEKEALLIDGTGKHPHYNFYRHAGVALHDKDKGQGSNESPPVNGRSNLP